MPQESLAIVRSLYEAAARRDTDAVFSLYDDQIVWDASRTQRGALAGRITRGRDGLRRWLHEWYGAWESVDDVLEELIETADGRVVSVMVQRGRGRASGVEVEDRVATVWTVRDG